MKGGLGTPRGMGRMDDWRGEIDRRIDEMAGELRAIRRHLHAHPEPSLEEYRTTQFIADRLAGAGIVHRISGTRRGVIAGPEGLGEGPRVAFRADIDALRIQDAKEVEYRSNRSGVMHACGHDAHTTMALGAALALHGARDLLPRTLAWRAIFQPAEEVGEGAIAMVAEGAVEGVDAILAMHVDPEQDVGMVAHRGGVLTAFCEMFEVTIRGRGGHAARPHLSADPIAAAAQMIGAVYQVVPRSIDSREPAVVSFGAIAGGANPNVIPDLVTLRGTIRTLGRGEAGRVHERIDRVARGVAEACEVAIEVAYSQATDAVVNDPALTDLFARAAAGVVGANRVVPIALPSMGSEDFSAYLAHARGCMLRLGVGSGPRPRPGLHHPAFDIDERALAIGAKVLARGVVAVAMELGRDGEDARPRPMGAEAGS
jgi:amidohydrolase